MVTSSFVELGHVYGWGVWLVYIISSSLHPLNLYRSPACTRIHQVQLGHPHHVIRQTSFL